MNDWQAIRGMNDILPEQIHYWQFIESKYRALMRAYGFEEMRTPLVEKTELFARAIGDVTDIVSKEMYTFLDRNEESLSLRPEGTAGCLRACLGAGLLRAASLKVWYQGAMFRHERPQKGRYRQFYQLGAEAFGLVGPDIDAELICLTARFWRELGLDHVVHLEINTLGTLEERNTYREALVTYFEQYRTELDADSQDRLYKNPLRILDSKVPETQVIAKSAPRLLDYLGEASRQHFEGLKAYLETAGINYRVNPTLVRGLDYYSHTVFEWVTDSLGAQGTVCAGGRYDRLVEMLGGQSCPAIGFALGVERLILLLETQSGCTITPFHPDAYCVISGEAAEQKGLSIAEHLRSQLPTLTLWINHGGGSFKTQIKRADKSGARIALILGDEEIAQGKIGIKYLREDKPQTVCLLSELHEVLRESLSN